MRWYVRKNFGDLSKTAKFLLIKNHANILDPDASHAFPFFVYITPEYEILAKGEPKLN